jgi:toxin ParE1/3/4
MAMPQVLRTSQAELDLILILANVGRHNPAAAGRLAAAINRKCELFATFPEMGTERKDLAPGLRCFPVGNFVIFCRPIDDGIELMRVVHSARDFSSMSWP